MASMAPVRQSTEPIMSNINLGRFFLSICGILTFN